MGTAASAGERGTLNLPGSGPGGSLLHPQAGTAKAALDRADAVRNVARRARGHSTAERRAPSSGQGEAQSWPLVSAPCNLGRATCPPPPCIFPLSKFNSNSFLNLSHIS